MSLSDRARKEAEARQQAEAVKLAEAAKWHEAKLGQEKEQAAESLRESIQSWAASFGVSIDSIGNVNYTEEGWDLIARRGIPACAGVKFCADGIDFLGNMNFLGDMTGQDFFVCLYFLDSAFPGRFREELARNARREIITLADLGEALKALEMLRALNAPEAAHPAEPVKPKRRWRS